MTINVLIFYQSTNVVWAKVYYSNTRHHFRINSVLLSLRSILHLRKIPNIAENWKVFLKWFKIRLFNSANFEFKQIKSLLQECKPSPLYSLGSLWYLRKKIQMHHKGDIFFHRIRHLIWQHAIKFQMWLDQVSYSNTRHCFCMNSALIPLGPILQWRKHSEYVTWFSRGNGINPEGFSLEPRETIWAKNRIGKT